MMTPARLMVILLCVLPSLTLHTHGDHGRHRRHRHHEHRFSDHHRHEHAHAHTHDNAGFVAPQSNSLDNSLYGPLVTEEPDRPLIPGLGHHTEPHWLSHEAIAGGGPGGVPRSSWLPGEGAHGGVPGSSRWALTYPGAVHQPSSAINNTVSNVTAQLGGSAFLPCRVGHLGDRQISWIRRRDWHVLTSADVLYTLDKRFSVLHVAGSQDWTLHIRSVDTKDTGTYECHVSTGTGIISLFVNLKVVIPEAHIPGQGHYHVNHGSPITLTCIIRQSPTPPQPILWHHNGQLLNYAHDRPEVKLSVKVGARAVSRLEVESARDRHSGNYTCSARHTLPAATRVFVTEGDKTAAVQRIDSGCESLQQTRALKSLLPVALLLVVVS